MHGLERDERREWKGDFGRGLAETVEGAVPGDPRASEDQPGFEMLSLP